MQKKPLKKIAHRLEAHGEERIDHFHWMRERDTEDVLEFLREENARVTATMKAVDGLEAKLYTEMRARIKEDDQSVPVPSGPYEYYQRYATGAEYAVHCRRPRGGGPEEIILDENLMGRDHEYFDVGHVDVSPDHRTLAFNVDLVGRRIYEMRFRDLSTGEMLPDRVEICTPQFAWCQDSKTLFFVRQDLETLRSYQVLRYELGSGKPPELVYEEKDTTYSVYVSAAKTEKHIFMQIAKRDSSECRVLDASQPRGDWHIVHPREMGHEYSVEDGGDRFFILTNWQALNFRVMEAPKGARDKSAWREVLPHSPNIFREDIDVYKTFVAVSERENGLGGIRLLSRDGRFSEKRVSFPDATYEMHLVGLPEYESTKLRHAYESMVNPPSVIEIDVHTLERKVLKTRQVLGYDASLYETERIWATAADGTKVPMSVLRRRGLKRDGQNPVLLYGYGSYGLSVTAHFSSSMLSLVDRGFLYVKAHIRGGSEMGRGWYEDGRLNRKLNSFTDFIACAEELIRAQWTSPEHLHIMGGSAGGLLMGAVMNMRPDLFRSVTAGVPFVDVLTTMLDESIPLTTSEYNEWGDPRKGDDYRYMRQYSPYDNIRAQAYPHVLITTGYHDSQVQYWEPAKWTAKLREMKTDQNHLLLYTEFEAGHGGASGRFEALKLLAKEIAFILMVEGRAT